MYPFFQSRLDWYKNLFRFYSSTGMNTARPPPPPVRSRESTVPNTRKSSMAPVCEQSKLEKSDSDCTYVSLEEIIEMRKILGENEVEVS
eukprot:m.20408 g.20408  ORF g.20408 m.20408 type:complete len:89 (-) comp6841_c0_seq2:94-360(-)